MEHGRCEENAGGVGEDAVRAAESGGGRLLPDPVMPSDVAPIAGSLRARPRWVNWRFAWVNDKWTKVPVNPATGNNAASDNPATWSSFEVAVAGFERWPGLAGIGFMFTSEDGLCGIDLDGCIDGNGEMAPEAKAIVENLSTYAETSPSGKGVKLILKGKKPPGAGCRTNTVNGYKQIEIYDNLRFFTITGQRLSWCPTEVEPRQEQLEALCRSLWPPKAKASQQPRPSANANLGDDDLIAKADKAKNAVKFRSLFFDGDTSAYAGDDSAADLALCTILAFWSKGDEAQIDRLFRRSALYREKWERKDYRDRTIAAANATVSVHWGDTRMYAESESPELKRTVPEIELGTDEHRVVEQVVKALEHDPDLYTRGTALVRVIRSRGTRGRVERASGSILISGVPTPNLRERITKFMTFTKYDKRSDGMVPAHPPGWLVSAVDARAQWPGLRDLNGISEVPFLRPDGSICQIPGYDAMTGVLYQPAVTFPQVPETPTLDDANRAVEELLEVVCDFNFEAPEHKAAWLAALLTALARHAFEGPAPLFLVDANIRGAGKGLLCHTIGQIVLGRIMPVSSYSNDTEELRKKITAVAIAADPIVLLDNLEGKFGNDSLDRALTTTQWKDRILGKSEQVDLPLMTVWFATGNNVLVAADTARRVVHIRLDVLDEHPEDRDGFKHPNLMGFVRENRGRLLVAALTLLSAYCRANRPSQDLTPMGSFEGWSDLVRSAVVWIGQPDPCLGRQRLVEFADTTADTLAQLIGAWRKLDAENEGALIPDLISQLYPADRTKTPVDDVSASMRSALEQLVGCAPGKVPSVRSVANKLKHFRRRVVGGYYLDIDESAPRRDGAVWCVRTTKKEESL